MLGNIQIGIPNTYKQHITCAAYPGYQSWQSYLVLLNVQRLVIELVTHVQTVPYSPTIV